MLRTTDADHVKLLCGFYVTPSTVLMMNPNPIIGRRLFVDGSVRPAFTDDAGHQYIIDRDGHTRVYGYWLLDDGADVQLLVPAME
jgi:hypothetical protein